MATYTKEIELQSAPRRVFEYLVDPDKHRAWRSDIREMSVSGRELAPGERFQITKMEGKRASRYEFEVTALDAPVHIAFRGHNENSDVELSYRLEPAGDGTRLTWTEHMEVRGTAGKVVDKLVLSWALPGNMHRMTHDLLAVIDGVEDPHHGNHHEDHHE